MASILNSAAAGQTYEITLTDDITVSTAGYSSSSSSTGLYIKPYSTAAAAMVKIIIHGNGHTIKAGTTKNRRKMYSLLSAGRMSQT
ncbi:MAG: hypothetical protein LIO75_03635 [Lachnospiraceae bacterium]|nr:hypothetical protein [Lachnospiraceae bacterium]